VTTEAHPVLRAALKAAPAAARPQTVHGGGPPPHLAPRELARLAIWCGERLASRVEPGVAEEYARALEEARQNVADPELPRRYPYSLGNVRYPTVPLSVGELAVDAARRAIRNPAATRVALCAQVRILVILEKAWARVAGLPVNDHVRELLVALDEQMVRLELEVALARYAPGRMTDVEAVLWRGLEGQRTGHWLVRLHGERHGLLTKLKGRWRWLEGNREEMLASVPDALFADAARGLARP